MPRRQWSAPGPLGRFVAGLAASWDDGAPAPVRVLPDGAAELLFSMPAGGGAVMAEVFGPKTRALLVRDPEPTEKIAVRLRPGAAARCLGVPAHTLADEALPLDFLWGREAKELAERLAEARGRDTRCALVEAALLARAARVAAPVASVEAAVAAIVASGGCAPVRTLARGLGASERRLERAFREHVGLGPKRFARVVRLERARSALACGASQLEAALAAGYHDQAHFHRDCRELAGVGPADL
jgi:AraC-like DNA-binding protein